ncbi:acetyl/propionyl/methylcrotonyl-CoA carboxylase subunit alpha [Siccirubricoccus sp. KC 17139]|uniref:Acetyl/propionyl/methylcrotonyl-CoA carboxylase subunit alpha n=1 Tax=Siccirubricoccus soli TaxID=2899147 RepID=A0ABT1D7W7_9PROT|nr:acetyl/propionyl/methylcrotonyl-CoA carboxylase subunit alpha [Siccirubricoccus soli]MCO6418029.1 acetyl/propionyl/methylcrotonyl-CoA carboxylase subunit alpha [Siccirubricoccus soli]MCP2684164.1 acetyl/propionyl/methylcrotonyl-CoA carboxylase subunit alpha [Siccirubricoccus soli]
MFRKLLIANRGEIACRVIATARRMGIATIAVYSEADAGARHAELADEAWPIGPAPARQSYLDIARILDAAKRAGAEAVHPGYGFLSENADFAARCAEAGLVFVGPPVEAIRAMGSKAESKALMARAGVPLVPGYHGEDQHPALLAAEAGRIGFPVLIKASAGGGGKGMRVVERAEEFAAALEGARREAKAAFGDDRVLVEKYLTRPRHIEIQVFADSQGNTISLFERDCSIQRRHQKVVEEAPAPGMDPARRAAMGEAACAAARAVGYVGAGTVEFIAEGDAFYFMEMNTRLQVEHPVTEMVTGLDLVEWQLRVAAGEALPTTAPQLRGHAIEVRLYAEDPARSFLPATGMLTHLRQPAEQPGAVRVDTGVRQGDRITPFYDPMIAKLIVWGEDRAAAVRRLSAALAEYEVAGLRTNLALLRNIAAHPAFAAAELDTGFIARHGAGLLATPAPEARLLLAAAALFVLRDQQAAIAAAAASSGDPWSPWATPDAWRLNGEGYQDLFFRLGEGEPTRLRSVPLGEGAYRLELPGDAAVAKLEPLAEGFRLSLDGITRRLGLLRRGAEITIILDGANHLVVQEDPLAPPAREAAGSDRVTAPVPGRVTRVLVQVGEEVSRNAPLLVIEAMKTEFTLRAPMDGVVAAVRARLDEMVEEGAELVSFAG